MTFATYNITAIGLHYINQKRNGISTFADQTAGIRNRNWRQARNGLTGFQSTEYISILSRKKMRVRTFRNHQIMHL